MKTANFIVSMSLAGVAFASPHKICKEAGLDSGDDSVDVTYSRDLSLKSDKEIKKLKTEIKQKLIIVAKNAIKDGVTTDDYKKQSDIKGSPDAIEYIRQINESRDEELQLSYLQAKNGTRFHQITFYPGAQVGTIFLENSLTTVATISDGDVMCVSDQNKE